MLSDSDTELDAAFGGAAPPPIDDSALSRDSEINAAFGEDAPTATGAAKTPPIYDPNRRAIGDELVNQLHGVASSMYHTVAGGYKGLTTLALTRDADKAAQVVEAEEAKTYRPPAENLSGAPANLRAKIAETHSLLPPTVVGDFLGDTAERAGASPGLSTALKAAGTVAPMLVAPRAGLGEAVPKLTASGAPEAAQAVVNKASEAQSMGAAGTPPDISQASPAGQMAIAKVDPAKLDTSAMQNHIEATSHGVDFTKGQATREPNQFSREQNTTHPDMVKRINEQNGKMVDALDTIRAEASPATVHNDVIQNGQTAVDSLKAYDEPVQADIRAKYKALEDANGGTLPMDTGSFLSNVDAVLKRKYLTGSVPTAGKEFLESIRAGEPLDFERFEEARSRLAEAQRNGGSEGTAAKLIRGQLEQMPLSPEAAQLKGLADQARGAARARFEALESDPAYQAAVDDVAGGVKKNAPSPLADKFIDNYALNAPKANLDSMMSKLDENGRGAVTSHTLNTLRKAAVNSNGNVLPKGYNDTVLKYGPKLDSLIPPETRQRVESLGRVITNAKVPPPGHSVNYSKSGVIVNAARGLGETAVNAKTLGMGVPFIKNIAEGQFVRDALAPYAGIEKP